MPSSPENDFAGLVLRALSEAGVFLFLVDSDYMVADAGPSTCGTRKAGDGEGPIHVVDLFPAALARGVVAALVHARRRGVHFSQQKMGRCGVLICCVPAGEDGWVVGMMPECLRGMPFDMGEGG